MTGLGSLRDILGEDGHQWVWTLLLYMNAGSLRLAQVACVDERAIVVVVESVLCWDARLRTKTAVAVRLGRGRGSVLDGGEMGGETAALKAE